MKAISWNIDGLKSALENKSTRGKLSYSLLKKIAEMDVDLIAIQETKLTEIEHKSPIDLFNPQKIDEFILDPMTVKALNSIFPGYHIYYSVSKVKKGYAGTMILSKNKGNQLFPDLNEYGEFLENTDTEGRITVVEYDKYYFVSVYTPNSSKDLVRLPARLQWDKAFKKYMQELEKNKPVIMCGDFNVAHTELELKNPKGNSGKSGFTDEERNNFTELLSVGFFDSLKEIYKNTEGMYTWWTQLSPTAKQNNSGWRIDYFLISNQLKSNLVKAQIIDSGERKDHTPILIEMNI